MATVLGSARLMAETGEEPGALRAAVTSPGGTTAAALRTLEFKAVRSAFIEAVAAAAERSRPTRTMTTGLRRARVSGPDALRPSSSCPTTERR